MVIKLQSGHAANRRMPWLWCTLFGVMTYALAFASPDGDDHFAVLVFSKTAGFRHDSIPAGIAALKSLGAQHRFTVDATEASTTFTDNALTRYRVVVFLNTTGSILNTEQHAAFERFIR